MSVLRVVTPIIPSALEFYAEIIPEKSVAKNAETKTYFYTMNAVQFPNAGFDVVDTRMTCHSSYSYFNFAHARG